MVQGYLLDLGQPLFWGVLAIAVISLTIVGRSSARFWMLGCTNAAFLWILGGWKCMALAVVFSASLAAAVWCPGRRWPRALVFGASAALALMFVLHKRADLLTGFLWVRDLRMVLLAMGFSYVALRSIELLRAIWEGKAQGATGLTIFNYLFPFHMLAAGPIQAWDAYDPQEPLDPASSVPVVVSGLDRIARGLFKKFVLAQAIEVIFLTGFQAKGWYLLWEVQIHYLWFFLDFSAYSDIAVGAGTLLGIRTPENFQKPLSARNIIVFWERWHISLSAFIRRNLFTPTLLGIMRNHPGIGPLTSGSIAFAVAFLLCGLWHGLSLRFLIWGLIHATALIGCNIYRYILLNRLGRSGLTSYLANPWLRVVATFLTFQFVAWSLAFVLHPALSFLR